MGVRVEGVRVDVNEELKFLCKFNKKMRGEASGRGVRLGRGVGQVRCEWKSEVFVKNQKKWGGGVGLGGGMVGGSG